MHDDFDLKAWLDAYFEERPQLIEAARTELFPFDQAECFCLEPDSARWRIELGGYYLGETSRRRVRISMRTLLCYMVYHDVNPRMPARTCKKGCVNPYHSVLSTIDAAAEERRAFKGFRRLLSGVAR